MPGQICEVRRRRKRLRLEGNDFLEPARPQTKVEHAELGLPLTLLEPDLERRHQLEKKGTFEEPQVAADALRADVCPQHVLDVRKERRLPRRLPGVAAGQPEHFFAELSVALAPAFSDPEMVLNHTLYDRLV